MKYLLFKASGRSGLWKIPEYNNDLDTYDIIHKISILGIIGAVIGYEQKKMQLEYKGISENLLVSVVSLSTSRKIGNCQTFKISNSGKSFKSYTTNDTIKTVQHVRDLEYNILVVSKHKSYDWMIDEFIKNINNYIWLYPTYFGQMDCQCDMYLLNNGETEVKYGENKTKSFVWDMCLDPNCVDGFLTNSEKIPVTLKHKTKLDDPHIYKDYKTMTFFNSKKYPDAYLHFNGQYCEVNNESYFLI